MEVEVRAVWDAFKYCISHKMNTIQVDIDLFILKDTIVMNWKIPWEFAKQREDIHEMVAQIIVVCNIFSERQIG